jgi:hypothetical protein
MPAKYAYALSSFKYADINQTTGLAENPVELIEAVYRDSLNITEEEGTSTPHYSEMDSTPKIEFTEIGSEKIVVQIMETQATMLQRFLGGTVATLDGSSAWSKPTVATNIEKFLDFTTLDGSRIRYPRAKVTGRRNFQLSRNKIWVIDVSITPLTPLLGTLAAVVINDPV